ncbi:MAG: hemolysin family protein [Desulfomicrobiaceae bacterium]
MVTLVITVVLVAGVSALCSLAEAALYAVPWSYIEGLRHQKRSAGEVLYRLRTHIDRPITAILTLNTVANTAGAAVAGAVAGEVLGEQWLWAFSTGFTLLILLLSEVVPKTIGVTHCRATATMLAPLVAGLTVLLRPWIFLVQGVVRWIQGGSHHGPLATEEDLVAMIHLSRQAGVIRPYEESSLRNILALDRKTVADIMTPRLVIFSLPVDLTVDEAWRKGAPWPHSRVPVYAGSDPEDIVGLVYRREVLQALAEDKHHMPLVNLVRPVEFVPEGMHLDRLLVRFLESRTHLMVVLDEYGGVSGVVSLEDVLEEILGKEIVDETDQVADMQELARRRRKVRPS